MTTHRRPRERFGDGLTPTAQLEPARCPSCDGELYVTCPNHCANAHEGATAFRHAAQRTNPPRKVASRVGDRVLDAMRQRGVLSADDVALVIGGPTQRAHAQLHYMVRTGKVRRVARGQYALGAA